MGEGAPSAPRSSRRPTAASLKGLRFGVELGSHYPAPLPTYPLWGLTNSSPSLRAETPPLPSPNTFQGPRLGTHFCVASELILGVLQGRH